MRLAQRDLDTRSTVTLFKRDARTVILVLKTDPLTRTRVVPGRVPRICDICLLYIVAFKGLEECSQIAANR